MKYNPIEVIVIYTYITSGTEFFLQKIIEKHPTEKLLLMHNIHTYQLIHETTGPTIFSAPRKYETIHSKGDYGEEGFVVMNHLQVRDEARPLFEYDLMEHIPHFQFTPSLQAVRLLRPLSNNTYTIITMWDAEHTFEEWSLSKEYGKISKNPYGSMQIFTFLVTKEEPESDETPNDNDENKWS